MSESFDLNRRLIEHSKELMEKSADYAKTMSDSCYNAGNKSALAMLGTSESVALTLHVKEQS